MTQTIYGRTEGLKKQVLTQLEAIYELRADEGQLISMELALLLRDLTEAINREISLYIDRKGQVTAVAVGSDCHVELPSTDSRRSQNRLCGVSCIHTHPSGAPRLSGVRPAGPAFRRHGCHGLGNAPERASPEFRDDYGHG